MVTVHNLFPLRYQIEIFSSISIFWHYVILILTYLWNHGAWPVTGRFYNRLLKQDGYRQLTQWNVPFPWYQFSSVQSLSGVWLFATPRAAARQASLSITNSQSLLKLMSIESVMPSNHLILCRPLLLLSSIFPQIRVFSNESVLHIMWPKYWSFRLQQQSLQWIFRTDFL